MYIFSQICTVKNEIFCSILLVLDVIKLNFIDLFESRFKHFILYLLF